MDGPTSNGSRKKDHITGIMGPGSCAASGNVNREGNASVSGDAASGSVGMESGASKPLYQRMNGLVHQQGPQAAEHH